METNGWKTSHAYIAFLRGINVGRRIIKMADLKEAFDSLGFEDVNTVLGTGNVLFVTPDANKSALTRRIEAKLKLSFGYEIGVLLRTHEEMQLLSDTNPFKGITVNPQTRLYVTFVSEKPKGTLAIPYESPGGGFTILSATGTEVCSVVTLSPTSQTTDLMATLAREFGNKITTRNWNTIARILKARTQENGSA